MLSAFLKRLLFARQFYIINGKVEVLGVREIMLPSSLVLELQDVDEKKSYEIVKKITNEKLKLFAKKLGTSEEGILKDIQDIYETFGLGSLQIIDIDQTKKRAIIRIRESPISFSYLEKNNKNSTKPTCSFVSAVLSGIFGFLFNKNVDVVEKICSSQGKDYCEFIIQSLQSKKA